MKRANKDFYTEGTSALKKDVFSSRFSSTEVNCSNASLNPSVSIISFDNAKAEFALSGTLFENSSFFKRCYRNRFIRKIMDICISDDMLEPLFTLHKKTPHNFGNEEKHLFECGTAVSILTVITLLLVLG